MCRRQVPEFEGFSVAGAPSAVVGGGGPDSGSYSWYHSLVNVTPAVETGLPSEKRGL
jgi:hypothetical protein